MRHEVAVVLPAFNEVVSISSVIRDVHRHLPDAFIVVVDNGSTDGTAEMARSTIEGGKGLVLCEYVRGKAQAVRRAFLTVDANIYVLCDADDTYSIAPLLEAIRVVREGEIDMAIGDRHGNGSYGEVESRRFHGMGNRLIAALINRIFHGKLRDVLSGFRVLSRSFVKNYPILARGFALEVDMTAFALDRRFRVAEFQVQYRARPKGSTSKLRTIPDGMRVLSAVFNLARYYRPFSFFGVIGVGLAVLGTAAGAPVVLEFINTGLVPRLPTAVLAAGLWTSALISFAIALILDSAVQQQRALTETGLMRAR